MINVLVYALPNRNSGGYSVIRNLYEDIKTHNYPNIHWFFIVGMDGFENTDSITVYNEEWALKTYLHRYFYNIVKVKEFVKEHDIEAVISLNMGVSGLKIPSIISLHNVLPFYRCDSSVFDRRKDMVKQAVINRIIIKSLKQAEYIIIPSNWIKRELMSKLEIEEDRIIISSIIVPEVAALLDEERFVVKYDDKKNHIVSFIYPSSGFPYKNHTVIINAAKKLKQQGIDNYYIKLAGDVGNGMTIQKLKKEIMQNNLPIDFCGPLSKEELVKAYQERVLLFPSKIETDGFPLLESMACGGYIIASNLEYAREALQNYDNYDLFEPDDENELSDLMKKVINSGNLPRSVHVGIENVKSRSEVIVPILRSIANKNSDRE